MLPPLKISVPPEIEAQGITLIRATDPGALSQLDIITGADRALIQGILPYVVLLMNDSPNRLLQVTVGFSFTDFADGLPRTFFFTHVMFNLVPPEQVQPGAARLFVPQRGLNLHFGRAPELRQSMSGWSDIIAKLEADFAKVNDLSAFIDSVTIEGIGLIGPDLARNKQSGLDRKELNT